MRVVHAALAAATLLVAAAAVSVLSGGAEGTAVASTQRQAGVAWDADLARNSLASLETRVLMGERLGVCGGGGGEGGAPAAAAGEPAGE